MRRLHALALSLFAAACGTEEAPARPPPTEPADEPADAVFRPIAGGVSWRAEEPFVADRPDNELRRFEYAVRDHAGATLTVSHFPASEGGGGDVRANVDRWLGQFEDASEPRIERREVNDLPVTSVDVRGTFVGRRGMGGGGPPRVGWRMLGAIVEGEQGLVFFKLLGPYDAVTIAEDAFERLVESIHPA